MTTMDGCSFIISPLDRCGDGKPCYTGWGKNAHWRCGTRQCKKQFDYEERRKAVTAANLYSGSDKQG